MSRFINEYETICAYDIIQGIPKSSDVSDALEVLTTKLRVKFSPNRAEAIIAEFVTILRQHRAPLRLRLPSPHDSKDDKSIKRVAYTRPEQSTTPVPPPPAPVTVTAQSHVLWSSPVISSGDRNRHLSMMLRSAQALCNVPGTVPGTGTFMNVTEQIGSKTVVFSDVNVCMVLSYEASNGIRNIIFRENAAHKV